MNAKAPPKPAVILATPINVEESRAQRLQRQQARFRDRGGIFVPTNRSTLVDILLGKASPLKKPRRSASVSPSKADEEKFSAGNDKVSEPALRKSPCKNSRKTLDVVTEEEPPAMIETEVYMPIEKAALSKTSRSRPQNKAKVPTKRTTKPKDGPESLQALAVVEDSVAPTIQKASKKTVNALETKSLKALTKKIIIPNADDDDQDDVPLVKSKPKGKRVSETKPQEVDGTKGTSKIRGHKAATATTSAVVTGSSRLKQSKKGESIYSELSEDDVACKPRKRASTKKVKQSAAPLGKAASKTLSVQKEEGNKYDSENSPKLVKDVACKPTRKSTAKKVKASATPIETEKREPSSSQRGKAPNVTAVPEGHEECNLRKEDTAPSDSSSCPKGKRRASTSITQDSDSQPRRKRIKSDTIQLDIDPSLDKKSKFIGKASLVASKKRRQNLEDAESGVEDGVNTGTKRKKHPGQFESKRPPEVPVEEDSVKAVAKKSSKTKATKPASKGNKQSPGDAIAASKRKENAPRSKRSKEKVVPKSGPPKSVLQRIKDSLGAQVVDNEPDPIDFLS